MYRHTFLAVITMAALGWGGAPAPADTFVGFEQSEGFQVGEGVMNVPGFTDEFGSPAPAVTAETQNSGDQALKVPHGADNTNGVKFGPAGANLSTFSVAFHLSGADTGEHTSAAWVYITPDAGSAIQVRPTEGTNGVQGFWYRPGISGDNAARSVSVAGGGQVWARNAWNTLTIALDHAASTFSVSVNGQEHLSDITMSSGTSTISEIWLVSTSSGEVYYDDLSIAVPEPTGLALTAAGLLGLCGRSRRLARR